MVSFGVTYEGLKEYSGEYRNEVFYDEGIVVSKGEFMGCSFRVDELYMEGGEVVFRDCNFNCSIVGTSILRVYFINCRFMGDLKGRVVEFRDCKAKVFRTYAIDNINGVDLENVGQLDIMNLEQEYFGHNNYAYMFIYVYLDKIVNSLSDYEKITLCNRFTLKGVANNELGGSIMLFEDKLTGVRFVMVPMNGVSLVMPHVMDTQRWGELVGQPMLNVEVVEKNYFQAEGMGKKFGYELLTIDEWTKCLMGGRHTIHPWGNDLENCSDYVVFGNTVFSEKSNKKANGWGLYNMVGNGYEWCEEEDSSRYPSSGNVMGGYVHSEIDLGKPLTNLRRNMYYEPNLVNLGQNYSFRYKVNLNKIENLEES